VRVINSCGGMFFSHAEGIANVFPRRNASDDELRTLMSGGDCIILFEGGIDINPAMYGEENLYSSFSEQRDKWESRLYDIALELHVPMLGICRGHQFIAAKRKGTLYQDISRQVGAGHSWQHPIYMTDDAVSSGFVDLMRSTPNGSPRVLQSQHIVNVNSMHHQAIKQMPEGGVVLARAKDTTVEAVLYSDALTVQWHPEVLGHNQFLTYMERVFLQGGNYAD